MNSVSAAGADQRLFDVGDAAKYLQSIGAKTATVNFVRGLITSTQVAHLRIGKKFYVTKTALDGWLETRARRSR
jgi:hypothetical protein